MRAPSKNFLCSTGTPGIAGCVTAEFVRAGCRQRKRGGQALGPGAEERPDVLAVEAIPTVGGRHARVQEDRDGKPATGHGQAELGDADLVAAEGEEERISSRRTGRGWVRIGASYWDLPLVW